MSNQVIIFESFLFNVLRDHFYLINSVVGADILLSNEFFRAISGWDPELMGYFGWRGTTAIASYQQPLGLCILALAIACLGRRRTSCRESCSKA